MSARRWLALLVLTACAGCAWWLWYATDDMLPANRPAVPTRSEPAASAADERIEPTGQRFAVPLAAGELGADHDALASGPPRLPSGNQARFQGRCLVAESGAPLAECVVRLGESGPIVARTGTDGSFDFGTELDTSGRTSLCIEAVGRVPRTGEFENLRDGAIEDLGDLPMQRGFVISGRVVDPDGRGVTGNNIVVFGITSPLRAGQYGEFTASAACAEDGSFTLAPAMPPGLWRAQIFGKDRQRGDGAFHIDAITGCAPLQLVCEVQVEIRGLVVDDQGDGVGDVAVRTENGEASTSSGPNGAFRLVSTQRVAGPTRILLANPGDWDDAFVPPTVTWGQSDVRLVMARGRDVTIEVIDQQGRPVSEFGVLFLPTERVSLNVSREHGSHPDGRLTLTTLRRGRHVLRVLPAQADLLASEPQFVTVTASALPIQRVIVERLRRAAVFVVDAGGIGIAGASVSLVRIGDSLEGAKRGQQDPRGGLMWYAGRRGPELVAKGTTGTDGTTDLFVPSSTQGFLLRIHADGQLPTFVEAPDFPIGAPLRIELAKGGALAGQVALHGQSRDLFAIELRDATGRVVDLPGKQNQLQFDGTFEVPLLPVGNCSVGVLRQVQARMAGTMSLAWATLSHTFAPATITAGETTHVLLDVPALAVGTLRGRLVPGNAALTAAGLALLGADNAKRGVFPIGADGSFFAEDLIPGRYQLLVAKDANTLMNGLPALLAREIEVPPGGELSETFAFTPRKLTLRLRSAAGEPIDAPVELRYGSLLCAVGMPSKDLVLDPAPEVPIQARYEGSANWSAAVVMPQDRQEHMAEVLVPPR